MITITLSDGTILSNITKNGDMYVSHIKVTKEMLNEEALKEVLISEETEHGGTAINMTDAVCDIILEWPDGWLFNIRKLTKADKLEKELINTQLALCDVYEMLEGE